MNRISLLLILLLVPFLTFAADKVKGANFFVVDSQNWDTGEGTGYWMWHAEGISRSVEGPFGTGAIDCHGAGFWDKEGSWGEGICVTADGEDTRTTHWNRDKGQKAGEWKMLTGTGRFAGIAGRGTYTSNQLPGGRQISEWEGEVTLAK